MVAVVVGAVLAAGSGSRMGTPKAELVVAGQRLLDRAVAVLHEGGCSAVFAVVRVGTTAPGARAVVNPDPDSGMRSSLALAVDAAELADAEALAVLLVDVPGVGAEAVRAVVRAWRPGRIAVAHYGGRRGHPTIMSPALWRVALAEAQPDEGARAWLGRHANLVDEVSVSGDATDLDTPADLAAWNRRGE